MKNTNVGFESVLCVYGENGEMIGFYRNDMKIRAIKFYGVSEFGLEDIKSVYERHGNYTIATGSTQKIKPE